ncbi:exocyst complex component 6B-like [Liolophura sinensis]|uniref:exocyst complex component 6B-like n=1 Tax=Liolophura sinensis TaxID=3198878 RepID=UPI003158E13A
MEIETSDGPLATNLRAVYESDELSRFMGRLDSRIKNHDKEIERMCNYHYQGFIDSIRELLQVGSDAEKLKDEIASTDREVQASSRPLLSKGEELIRCRKIQKNIASAIESISLCLPVLEMYGKLREQMHHHRYYPALKTLEQLEHTYLPRVSRYWFSQTMADTIPKLRESIKAASMSELKDFLENIRKHSTRIGETAMRHAAEQNNLDPDLAKKKRKRKAPAPPNPFTGEVEEEKTANPFDGEPGSDEETEEELSAQDMVDFSPVYRCLHIYSVLGARETFETYYRKQRKIQAKLSLQAPQNMHETLDGYKRYFHDIIGFFVVEDHILHTTAGLVNRSNMDELWEMAVTKIVGELHKSSALCKDDEMMLQIKNLIVLFCHTLRGYGFSVGQLSDLLLEIRDKYNEILMQKWSGVFDGIFNEDNYTPIYVRDAEECVAIMDGFPLRGEADNDKVPYPKGFPYSEFVPKIYSEVKKYIQGCLKFSEDLHLSHTEIDDMIRKSANMLLTKTLSGCLSKLIRRPNLTLLQLIQISINMNYLEKSCAYLEDFISSITGAEKDSVHVAKLHGTSMFKDAKNEAEEQIYKQLNNKIDEFLELASYDWLLVDPKGHASGYLMDLIAFLQSTFMSFTNLPDKVAKTACMSSCKHISTSLMQFLLDNDMKQISMGALQQFNLDLMQCEQFAASEPVPGFNDGTLQLAFSDLRQLLDLFLNWDWSVYLADYGQPNHKYIRVTPHTAITILEKLNNADKKKNNLFAWKGKNERDKKKLLDTVLKQLRGLVNGTAPHS